MKSYLFVSLALLFAVWGHAQNSITGTITAANDGMPIPATIHIPQLEKGTIANNNGIYTINNIPNGTYTVVYSYLGFATISEKTQFVNGTIITRDVILEESAVEIEEVIISTPFHKLQSDNVMKVERVSTDALNSRGAVTLAEGITNIPGVNSVSTGLGIGKPVIRGLSSNRVLTYAQGVRLENQQFGDEHGLGINEAGIESVEVIKGPASLLYGSDALGGVLYLNPERFASSNTTEGDLRSSFFSNTIGFGNTAGFRSSGEQFKFLARTTYVTHSDYETGDGDRVTNSRFNETDLKTGIRFQNNALKSTFRYNYNRSNIGIPEEIAAQTTSKSLIIPYQKIDNHLLSLENTFYFNNSSLDAKFGYTFNDRSEFEDHHEEEEDEEGEGNHEEGEEGEEAALRLKLNTLSYDLKYNLPELGNFETIVGIQGLYQTNENFGEEILIPDATKIDFGIFATTHYHLEKVDLQAGLRYDHRSINTDAARDMADPDFIPALDKNFSSFNAAIGAKIVLAEPVDLRINLASGFRAPNLAELTSNGEHEGTNRYEVGDPNLENEQNVQLDVSAGFRNKHVEIFGSGFYNLVNNYIFIEPTGMMIEDSFVFNYKQNDAYLYGGEFGLHLHPHPLDWLHLESSFESVVGRLKNVDSDLPLIPANTVSNTFRVEFEDGSLRKQTYVFLGMRNTLKQSNISEFETPTPGYTLINTGVGGTLQFEQLQLDLGLSVTNLFNTTYIAHLSRLKVDGIPNMGRNLKLSVKATL
ncbi:TonB-dependent receptor [Candidatus Ulvibacter alkanivorans]|uniref:TonB-dependent receptor n=1 Tax=Candidatus Ulvibacter alkanivorans TaxID=2267620 RepID=UPI000DF1F5BD|nr:TonB-dependent receptor [Candidatus Ulvibacter alkanivorans]